LQKKGKTRNTEIATKIPEIHQEIAIFEHLRAAKLNYYTFSLDFWPTKIATLSILGKKVTRKKIVVLHQILTALQHKKALLLYYIKYSKNLAWALQIPHQFRVIKVQAIFRFGAHERSKTAIS